MGWRHNPSDQTHARTHAHVYTDLQENVCIYAGRSTNTVQTRTRCPLYRVHENFTARRTEGESTSQYKKNLLYKQRRSEGGLRVTAFRKLRTVLAVSTLYAIIRRLQLGTTPLKTYVRIIWSYRFTLFLIRAVDFLSPVLTWHDSPQGTRFNSRLESAPSRMWSVTAVHWKNWERAFWICVFEVRQWKTWYTAIHSITGVQCSYKTLSLTL
jgi:hypothetical protein